MATAGNVFVAIPAANLTLNSQSKNAVQFTADPASSGRVTATLPAPFSRAVNLLTGLNTTGKTLAVITTFTTENVTFALSGYADIGITGATLMVGGAAVKFTPAP